MVKVARGRLVGTNCQYADEEDVALSAFKSFWRSARDGQFPDLADRTDLWPLLLAITRHKATDLTRFENRQKRGGPKSSGTRPGRPRRATQVPLHDIPASEPSPDFIAQLNDQLRQLMLRLRDTTDPDLQQIALWRMNGESKVEIAAKLGCVPRTVERKLRIIASLWRREEPL